MVDLKTDVQGQEGDQLMYTSKVFRKPCGSTTTTAMLRCQTEDGWLFETTGVDFTGPLDMEWGECYVLIFTCSTSRAVHLEVMKLQMAEEFQRKENFFMATKRRPHIIILDNTSMFLGYCKLDKEDTEEWETTRPSYERRHQMAVQPSRAPDSVECVSKLSKT